MGRFYLPKDTMGVFDQGNRSLIVYAGRESSIGFEGSVQEINALDFSFSDDPIMEVYSVSAVRRETLLPTSMRGSYTVAATNGDGKNLASPIEVQVVSDRFAEAALPEGQEDGTACWIACISWASQSLMRRPTFSQEDIRNASAGKGLWMRDGSISIIALERLLAKEFSALKLKSELIKPDDLGNYINLYPVLIGYQETLFPHMNVIYGHDGNGNLDVMDPWWPDPESAGWDVATDEFGPTISKSGSADVYVFDGMKTQRSISYYTSSPLQSGKLWVAYPRSIE
jgi:Papain-like cysteine protease AvrRpt2